MRQAKRCRIYAKIQASEPEQNPKNLPQFIEKLSVARFQQVPPPVQMQRKKKHLNLASRQNPATNPLTTNALQDFQRLHPWFRSLAGLEYCGMQTCPGGTSGWGIRQTRNRTAQASEPRQNPKNSL